MEATVRTVLAWEDATAAQARLDTAERNVGDALAALAKEKVPAAHMVTLTGIGQPLCARLLRIAGTRADSASPGSELAVDGDMRGRRRPDAAR